MANHAKLFNVERMASLLGVSRSGYYAYLKREPSVRSQSNQTLLAHIKRVHAEHRGVYGSPRVHAALRQQGVVCSLNRVARLMRENNIKAKSVKVFKRTTQRNPNNAYADNVLQQDFSASQPNKKWVSDITYIYTAEGWLYLAVILDLYSRFIVGLSMSARMTKALVMKAFNQAVKRRGYPTEFMYHSDRVLTAESSFYFKKVPP